MLITNSRTDLNFLVFQKNHTAIDLPCQWLMTCHSVFMVKLAGKVINSLDKERTDMIT